MSIFSRPAPEPVVTGVDILRQATKARDHRAGALKIIAREINDAGIGISIAVLEDFSNAKAELSVAQLRALAREIFPFAEYDPVSGMLRAANKAEPKPLCAASYVMPLDPETVTYPPRMDKVPRLGPQPTVPPPPRSTSRPGWAGSFFAIEHRLADHKPKQPFVRALLEAYD